MGGGAWKLGKKAIMYLLLHCHHQDDSCMKVGTNESHFNVSLNCEGQCRKTVSTNHNLFEEKGKPHRNQAEALCTSLMSYREAKPAHRAQLQLHLPALNLSSRGAFFLVAA